ncbi:MAG: response regulator transcription factor [Acidobacteria bacterium]|nr:response regulator transcription factor [Acidobacteriota bacterium]
MSADATMLNAPSGSPAHPINVWLVEDNETYRGAIARALDHAPDLRCTGAFGSCEAALGRLREDHPPEIILLDIGLPGMSGLDGIQQFKELSPATHVIILTVFEDTDKIVRAICAGAAGYLLKTSPAEKIAQAIREVLGGGAPMTPQIARSVLGLFARMAGPPPEHGLSQREKETLEFLVQGLATKEIADRLDLSIHTVDTHLRNIYRKLHVHSRAGAVGRMLQAKFR